MKILQILSGIRSEAAGTSYSVPALCRELGSRGHEVALHVLSPVLDGLGDGYAVHAHPRSGPLAKLGSSLSMRRALRSAAHHADIMHSHGLWLRPNIYPSLAARRTRCRSVLSPRGMLDPWAFRHHRLRKLPIWLTGQRASLRSTDCFHATVEQEYQFVRDLGFRAPVAIIPNGVTVPDPVSRTRTTSGRRRLLYLARVHPKKGVDRLLRAWRNVQERFNDWELEIVGADDGGYLPVMRRLAAELGTQRASFTGMIPEFDKPGHYRAADLYILPTHTENWGVSVGEALSHGLPAIVGRGAPWSGLEVHRCGWWVDISVDSLTDCLNTVLALPDSTLREYGARGREWVQHEFRWTKVGSMMDETYRWLVSGGQRPGFVRVD